MIPGISPLAYVVTGKKTKHGALDRYVTAPDGSVQPYIECRESFDDILDREKFVVNCMDCGKRITKGEANVYTFFGHLRHMEHT